jgi:hypothetical protein
MNRADRERYRDRYNRANAAAHRKAQDAHGLFLRADDVADLQYVLRRAKAGDTGPLTWRIEYLLEQHGIEPVELRASHPFERPLTIEELQEHPSLQCARCRIPSVEIGGGYHECPRCRHGFLVVLPGDPALDSDST